ncbi:hypothetical protein GCM10009117_04530 [Gangjinia marincola]|uniref:Putative auto-transporter adhesin head GIN domain-containing protein n=1 Tax=Gangjinia marincola TaxID=578463 RepID=A0ABN1MDX5_9FLAO
MSWRITDNNIVNRVHALITVILFSGLISCDTETAPDCFQVEGDIIEKEIDLPPFSKITVNEKIQLFVSYGENQLVTLETGENLLNEIELRVEGDRLIMTNSNGCNIFRDYAVTKVYVTLPEFTEIRHFSEFTVTSTNTIKSNNLRLLTEDNQEEEEQHTNGDFDLTLEVETLRITSNGNGNYILDGTVAQASFGIFSGDTRIEAGNLLIDDLELFHRGSNKMIVNPLLSIKGELYSTGDVIAKNEPAIVEVEEFYTGRLIFE